MKLMLAIVQDEDATRLVNNLTGYGFSVTKLATTGGFLKAGNTTLIMGVEDEKVDDALAIVERVCQSRKQIATSPAAMTGAYLPYSFEVTVGGATVFVMNVETFKKM